MAAAIPNNRFAAQLIEGLMQTLELVGESHHDAQKHRALFKVCPHFVCDLAKRELARVRALTGQAEKAPPRSGAPG